MNDKLLLSMARRFEFPNGILVDFRGDNKWSIRKNQEGTCWSEKDSEWFMEMLPSSRDEYWYDDTRYTFEKAIEIAERLDKLMGA
jgi:hypothetical protein